MMNGKMCRKAVDNSNNFIGIIVSFKAKRYAQNKLSSCLSLFCDQFSQVTVSSVLQTATAKNYLAFTLTCTKDLMIMNHHRPLIFVQFTT
jgi:hypothetical protein